MKVRVLKPFICTKTKGRYDIGDIYNGDTDTIAALAAKGYVLARFAHVPKAEVATLAKMEVLPPTNKPKRKRKANESK